MGDIVEFPSNGQTCQGYLALPDGSGPGVVVIQEWWGLVPHIKDVCDRFEGEGFVALAPDLYHGKTTTEPNEAQKLAMSLEIERAGRDMAGAVSFLREHERVDPKKVGCVGYCMGGALALNLATIAPIDAAAPYYGLPMGQTSDWSKVRGPILGHYAGKDEFFTPAAAEELFGKLREMGKDATMHTYEDADHGFFNDQNAGAYDEQAAKLSWERTLAFFNEHLR
jgi:carboxymethylenebutenolidase